GGGGKFQESSDRATRQFTGWTATAKFTRLRFTASRRPCGYRRPARPCAGATRSIHGARPAGRLRRSRVLLRASSPARDAPGIPRKPASPLLDAIPMLIHRRQSPAVFAGQAEFLAQAADMGI